MEIAKQVSGENEVENEKRKLLLLFFYTPSPPSPFLKPHAPLPASLSRCSAVLITSITDRCGLWYSLASSACRLAASSSLRPAEKATSAGELAPCPPPAAAASVVVVVAADAASRKRSRARRRMYSRML